MERHDNNEMFLKSKKVKMLIIKFDECLKNVIYYYSIK